MSAPAATSYRLGELLGEGGMGCVYAAEDDRATPVAVKLLRPAFADDPAMIVRLYEEARAAQRVSHRNVVRVRDYGVTADGAPFLVMDRVAGTSLGEIIRREGPLSLSRISRIATRILAGLAAIHDAGLVHGDMKSDNILVESSDSGDRVTIVDFGLARPHPPASAAPPEDQILSGTPEYMAPELIRSGVPTAASDLYAVGIILYEMLTGTTPFRGGGTVTICARHLHDEIEPPSSRDPRRAIPRSFERAVLCVLEKTPAARYRSAAQFAHALHHTIPIGADDLPNAAAVQFSTEAPTRDWLRPCRKTALAARVAEPFAAAA